MCQTKKYSITRKRLYNGLNEFNLEEEIQNK